MTRLSSQSPAFFLLLVVSVILFVALIFQAAPAPTSYSSPSQTHFDIASYNNTDFATPPPPPASCELCVLNATDPLCHYGIDTVRMSRTYEGSGYRVRRFLEKALRGEPVSIGVLGASVSMGHGIAHLGRPTWHQVFFADFVKIFPSATIHEGLAAGTDSDFFAHCYETLLPKDLDLYFIEVDINNEMRDKTLRDDDALYRSLLELPQQPAVIRASVVALFAGDLSLGAMSAAIQSQFFDVPAISLRNFLLPHFMLHPTAVSNYLSRQSDSDPEPDIFKGPGLISRLPKFQFDTARKVPPVDPSCFFTSSDTRPLRPTAFEGDWHIEKWNDKAAWNSFVPHSRISFAFNGTSVGLFVWETNGVGNKIQPGFVTTWLDDDTANQRGINAFNEREHAGSAWIQLFENLTPGPHILNVLLLPDTKTGGNDFRIMGMASL